MFFVHIGIIYQSLYSVRKRKHCFLFLTHGTPKVQSINMYGLVVILSNYSNKVWTFGRETEPLAFTSGLTQVPIFISFNGLAPEAGGLCGDSLYKESLEVRSVV
jgi:hypothetical protein